MGVGHSVTRQRSAGFLESCAIKATPMIHPMLHALPARWARSGAPLAAVIAWQARSQMRWPKQNVMAVAQAYTRRRLARRLAQTVQSGVQQESLAQSNAPYAKQARSRSPLARQCALAVLLAVLQVIKGPQRAPVVRTASKTAARSSKVQIHLRIVFV